MVVFLLTPFHIICGRLVRLFAGGRPGGAAPGELEMLNLPVKLLQYHASTGTVQVSLLNSITGNCQCY